MNVVIELDVDYWVTAENQTAEKEREETIIIPDLQTENTTTGKYFLITKEN